MSNEITVTCPNCHEDVTLKVEVSYLHSAPKSLSAQIGRCRGDHDCAALRPKPGRPRKATVPAPDARSDEKGDK